MPALKIEPPIVQVAIDVLNVDDALRVAEAAVNAGVDWLEAGTPLITFCGTPVIGALHRAFPHMPVLADYKTMDGARKYALETKAQGGSLCTVCYQAGEACMRSMVVAGKEAGVAVVCDLINAPDPAAAGAKAEAIGMDAVYLHWGADQKAADPGRDPMRDLAALVESVSVPVGAATWDLDDAIRAAKLGASIFVIGYPIIGRPTMEEELREYVLRVKEAWAAR
jgi:3-hexulose-6-phosphate synthase/6-phospho-3-hexuloisomerase